MSELEPTRTNSNLTATDELRRMLDERGVEWRERVWGGKHSVTTFWHARGVRWHYRENRFGELRLHADGLAPEQAIAATLGAVEYRKPTTLSQLEAENAKLRDEFDRMDRWHSAELQAAMAENSKLRELVRILKNCADECGDCDTCPINGEPGVLNPWLGCDSLRDRMRELGIEASA